MAYPRSDSTRRWLKPNIVRPPMRITRRRGPGQQRTQFGFREGLPEEVSVMHRDARPRKELLRPAAGGSRTHLVDIDVHVSPTATAAMWYGSQEKQRTRSGES